MEIDKERKSRSKKSSTHLDQKLSIWKCILWWNFITNCFWFCRLLFSWIKFIYCQSFTWFLTDILCIYGNNLSKHFTMKQNFWINELKQRFIASSPLKISAIIVVVSSLIWCVRSDFCATFIYTFITFWKIIHLFFPHSNISIFFQKFHRFLKQIMRI